MVVKGVGCLYSPNRREKLSDKSKQALLWEPASGQNWAKTPSLAVSSAIKTVVEKPSNYLSDSFSRPLVNKG